MCCPVSSCILTPRKTADIFSKIQRDRFSVWLCPESHPRQGTSPQRPSRHFVPPTTLITCLPVKSPFAPTLHSCTCAIGGLYLVVMVQFRMTSLLPPHLSWSFVGAPKTLTCHANGTGFWRPMDRSTNTRCTPCLLTLMTLVSIAKVGIPPVLTPDWARCG